MIGTASRGMRWTAVATLVAGLWSCTTSAPPAVAPVTRVPVLDVTPGAADQPGRETGVYLLAIGDEVDVRVPDAPQYDQTAKIRPDGKITLNFVGSVYAAGRTPDDVQGELRERYVVLAGSDQARVYLIHSNDELEIKFPYYSPLNDQMRVRPDGKIQLQLAGTVQAEGVSPEDLELELRRRYARYLKEPELSVIVKTATSQTVRTATGMGRGGLTDVQPLLAVRSFQTPQVFVTGEVSRPGMVAYVPGLTLLQVLSEAGGNMPSGDITKLVILRRTTAQSADVIRPGLTKAFRSDPTGDVTLQPYDVILLPPTRAQTLAEALDWYVYKLFAPLKNSSFGFVYGTSRVY